MVKIDDSEYSIEYVRKAIKLYSAFENGTLEKLLESKIKEAIK